MVTLKDIAQKTGLTASTISKALNGSSEISESTTRLVREAAAEMGYQGRRNNRRRSNNIGVLLPEVRSHYYAELMHSLHSEIIRHGYTMIAALCDYFADGLEPAYDRLCQNQLEGLFIAGGTALNDDLCRKIVDRDIPAVMFTEYDVPYPINTIYSKMELVMELALDHLVSLGHRDIGYIGEYNSDTRYHTLIRLATSRNCVEINPDFCKRGSERFEHGGYLRAQELLLEKRLPTAIIASYDQVAIGAIRAFREKGLRVPEDISVIGIDNAIIDEYLPVPLTSIMTPVNHMGVVAVKILVGNINHPQEHIVQNVSLQSKLIVRSSTCPAREKISGRKPDSTVADDSESV